MSTITESHTIGGLRVRVYKSSKRPTGSIAAVFLLHGRLGFAEDVDSFARICLKTAEGQKQELYVITLDHRNHGSRLMEERANKTWEEGNGQHAVDMYAIQMGTARDLSFLVDFLPMYLFPHAECKVDAWGVIGISLGGHSTWIALSQGPRISVGIPIIGCPDYLALMKHRAQTSGIAFTGPHIPASLLDLIGILDPASKSYSSLGTSNPFLGKKILILSGEEDTLVPWTASKTFVESLEVGLAVTKRWL
ncbi:hypothetical protein CPB84DRAFT_1093377 [Gymnopilus junonius]|uniref:Uncharacterized protein n=1 Tax=Gymnopilus junonius TaxID=109634 RepID=A0A9P5TLV6_GYMJU|nr:hypothetical protein CPB84DRAFT_1093377 [Gymnopilus junonius]